MKKYTFKIDNNFKNENTSNNYSKTLTDTILANIKNANPYLFDNKKSKKTITIDIDIPMKKVYKKAEKFEHEKKISYNSILDAINFFYDNISTLKKDYDFKLSDGTPVKMFSDEIQIGYDLIPLNDFTKAYYDMLSKSSCKKIMELYINIAA